LHSGWHLIIRHAVSIPPLKAPYFFIAVNAYSEHIGVNLQDGGSHGEMAFL
jgi:hypothetical protein